MRRDTGDTKQGTKSVRQETEEVRLWRETGDVRKETYSKKLRQKT